MAWTLRLPGSGTKQDPWRIQSLPGFKEFADNPGYWAGYARLETDVNLAGRTYSTAVIAPDSDNTNWDFDGTPYTGFFDGNDKRITNMTINDGGVGNNFLGLFGFIDGGEVKNLGLECASVTGTGWCVGGLIGDNWEGSVSNCYFTGDVNSVEAGGLVGYNEDGSVSNCYSAGNVNGDYDVGGLVCYNYGIVSNCYSTGNVSGDEDVGGLIGWNDGIASHCYSTANVNGDEDVGGLVGDNDYGSVSNCYYAGEVNGTGWYVGGLVGFSCHDGSVSNCCFIGKVSGDEDVGGLIGWNDGIASNCCSNGEVNGGDYVGGLAGENWDGYVSNCYSTADVNGAANVGGLLGYNYNSVSDCFWDTDTQTHGVTESIGLNDGDVNNVQGLPTTQMQTRSTFTDAGWDFVGETTNGTEDIWTIHEAADYPKFVWKLVNFIGWYEVDSLDYAFFANRWQDNNCGAADNCEGADLNFSDKVDWADLKIFADHWLKAKGS